MRESFRKNIMTMGELAKDELKKTQADNELRAVIDYTIRKFAENRGTPEKTQKKIYDLQKEKQRIMTWLHERFKEIDNRDMLRKRRVDETFVTTKTTSSWSKKVVTFLTFLLEM